MYVSDNIREQIKLSRFREALEGRHRAEEASVRLSDFGVAEQINHDQLQDVAVVFGRDIMREQQEAEQLLGAEPEMIEESAPGMAGMMARLVMNRRSARAQRAQEIVSHSSTVAAFGQDGQAPKQTTISGAFHQRALDPLRNDDPAARDVNAVRMIMENIADWDFHARHDGDTLTADVFVRVVKLLETNLRAACPAVKDYQTLNLLMEMKRMGHLDELGNLQHVTQTTVAAYLDAQNGNPHSLKQLNHSLSRFMSFYERFYGDRPVPSVPMRTLAQALEKQEERSFVSPGVSSGVSFGAKPV